MKKIVFFLIILTIEVSAFAEEGPWIPPVGIPEPSFGINETYRMYDYEPNQNPALTYYESESGGYYTHYIDANDPNSTDSGNDFGTKAVPRRTIPQKAIGIPAGSIVEVHSQADVSFTRFRISGTEDMPVFIRGVGIPEIIDNFELADIQYVIVEGFLFSSCGVKVRVIGDTAATHNHHVCIRNNEMRGQGILYTAMDARVGITGTVDVPCDNIIVYNNEIHHWGDSESTVESGNDLGGVHVGSYTHYLWILDNHIHHGGGDSILLCHGSNLTSGHIYIGGNIMHDDRENAVDVKDCTDVIISQNTMYNYNKVDSSSGAAVVIHYGNSNPATRGTKRAWVLFNTIYDFYYWGSTTADTNDTYYIGNIIYDTNDYAFQQWSHGSIGFVMNTMYNVNGGIDDTGGSTTKCVIANNIFGKLAGNKHISLDYTDYRNNAIVENNLFAEAFVGNKSGTGAYIGDPMFVNPEIYDFNLQPSSPVDNLETADVVQAAFQKYYDLYNIDITCDIEGLPRINYEPIIPEIIESIENTDTVTEPADTPEPSSEETSTPITEEPVSPINIQPLPLSIDTQTEDTDTKLAGLSTIGSLNDTDEVSSGDEDTSTIKVRKIRVRRILNKYESLYVARNNGKGQGDLYE